MGELRACPRSSGPAASTTIVTMIHSQAAQTNGERGDATFMTERRHHDVCQRWAAVIAQTCATLLSA